MTTKRVTTKVELLKRKLKGKKGKQRNGEPKYRWALRWFDPHTGQRLTQSTGTADRTAANELAKLKWAEINIPGAAPVAEPEPVEVLPGPTWQECRDALQRAMEADNMRPSSVADYLTVFEGLRRMFSHVASPADITPAMAGEWKRLRAEATPAPSPWSIRGDLATIKAVFNKWLMGECELLKENPFAKVKPPKCDAPDVRIVSADESTALFAWLKERWPGWRLPELYLRAAMETGWRAMEVASLGEDDILADGFVRVSAGASKTREPKFAQLPGELHAELKALVAHGFVFGKFADDLRRLLMVAKGMPNHAARVGDFAPARLVGWLQDELQRFCKSRQVAEHERAAKEGRKPATVTAFTLHDFRRTAITGMQMAGISEKACAKQVGVSPEVMRRHYDRLCGMEIAKRNRLAVSAQESGQLHVG